MGFQKIKPNQLYIKVHKKLSPKPTQQLRKTVRIET